MTVATSTATSFVQQIVNNDGGKGRRHRRHTSQNEDANGIRSIPQDPFSESVYRLIPVPPPPPEQHKIYRSKFAGQARIEYASGVKQMASMGPAKVQVNSPHDFLKKHEKDKPLPSPKPVQSKTHKSRNKAPVPTKQTENTAKEEKTEDVTAKTANFVTVNALHAINMVPKPYNLDAPSYLKKKDYGKTPGYLLKRRQENIEQQEQEKAAERARKEEENKRFTAISEEDRLKILAGLQAKWEQLNTDYQKLSLTVDTVPKINRKVSMENQLKVIEQDIEKFSQSNIFIKLV